MSLAGLPYPVVDHYLAAQPRLARPGSEWLGVVHLVVTVDVGGVTSPPDSSVTTTGIDTTSVDDSVTY
jgi:hypothetical protein